MIYGGFIDTHIRYVQTRIIAEFGSQLIAGTRPSLRHQDPGGMTGAWPTASP
ncbi:hypothetical protein AB0N09_33255 [Streptomyces erythrochromogenes]|uniref:hypothetical protein n=1 Tax=Streptomyces erythrochromogenes TaxID=285574 RepID=UPI00343BDEBD